MSTSQPPGSAEECSGNPAPLPRPVQSVLFACTFNAVRSPMAANLLLSLADRRKLYVQSAGVVAGELDPFAVEVLREVGVDMAGHVPHTFESLGDVGFDIVVCLSREAYALAMDLARLNDITVEYWPVPDPPAEGESREQRLLGYRTVRDALLRLLEQRFQVGSTREPN